MNQIFEHDGLCIDLEQIISIYITDIKLNNYLDNYGDSIGIRITFKHGKSQIIECDCYDSAKKMYNLLVQSWKSYKSNLNK